MSDVVVQTFTIPNWRWGGSTAKLRLYASASWTDSAGVPRMGGTVGSPVGFYQEVDLTISSNTVTVPQFTTQSTLDSIDLTTVRITGVLFDSTGARRDTLFDNWFIPTSTPTTWAALRIMNAGRGLVNPPSTYLTSVQTQALIDLEIAGAISGSVNTVAKFTAANVVGDSSITDASGIVTIASHVLPGTGNTYDLGGSSTKWRNFYTQTATIKSGTVTTSTPLIDSSQTWNNSGLAFTAWALNVTDTTSLITSLLLDLQLASTSVFSVGKAGNINNALGTITNSGLIPLSSTVTWNSGGTSFRGIKLVVTDTASAAGALLLDLETAALGQVFTVDKGGRLTVYAAGQATSGTTLGYGIKFAGTWFSGGTSTTTKPMLFVEPSGTTSTAWSTAGTGLGVNAPSGFTGNLLDLQLVGVSQLAVSSAGIVTLISTGAINLGGATSSFPAIKRSSTSVQFRLADDSANAPIIALSNTLTTFLSAGSFVSAGTFIEATTTLGWAAKSLMSSPSDGVIGLYNNALSDFSRLQFGGTSASFPAIKRVSASLQFRLADDSSFAAIATGSITASGNILLGASNQLAWTGRSIIQSPSDGVLQLTNAAESDFTRVAFGGATSSFPAIQRDGAGLAMRLSDDSAYTYLTVSRLTATQGTLTTGTPFIVHTTTWNSGGTTFDNLTSDVTDTASHSASRLMLFRVGGSTKLSLGKAGNLTLGGETETANKPMISTTQTWNNGAVTFQGWKLYVSDSASAAASLLLDLQVDAVTKFSVRKDGLISGIFPAEIMIACSDETTALTTGTAKVTFRMPYAMTLTGVVGSVTTAATGVSLLTIDVNNAGSTILSTKLTFDASEKTTRTAATPPVISAAALALDDEITIDIDQVGSTIAGAGLKIYLIGTRVV